MKLRDLKFNSLYRQRCRCKEQISITKKKKRSATSRSEGKPLQYLEPNEINEIQSTTFQIKYETKLSPIAKLVLNSFHKKYIYYAIDDILYSFPANREERDNLLAILYSPVLSLQNNCSINFFDIWIEEIYINEVTKENKFLHHDSFKFEPFSSITMKLFYKIGVPIQKPDPLW